MMKWILHTIVSVFLTWAPLAKAGLIAGDLLSTGSLNRVSFTNQWQSGFDSNDDLFAIVSGSSIADLPSVFIDETLNNASDNLGIIEPQEVSANDSVFAISDTKNSNTQDIVEASWVFDVSSGINSVFSLELAAMGDFENSDWFTLELEIEAINWRQLFEFNVDESSQQSYQLASGKIVTLSDPLVFEGKSLSNHFQSFSWRIPDADVFSVTLSARADGGSEGLIMRNMEVSGQSIAVPEPSSLLLFVLGWLCLMGRLNVT